MVQGQVFLKGAEGSLGIIKTKMEVGIQFWVPNLGFIPKVFIAG